MATKRPDVVTIFGEAVRLEGAARQEYLEAACRDDPTLRAEVESLLEHHVAAEHEFPDEHPAIRQLSDELSAEPAPDRIGPYRILERLGSGGMGEVYLAKQPAPARRRVALKIVSAEHVGNPESLARFDGERQALALVDHPGIVAVHECGATDDGRPYFTMEYVAGQPITRYADDQTLNIEARLRLVIDLCDAVEHMHLRDVIHRDLKPAHVLISRQDGRPRVKVIDFGIAKSRLVEATGNPLLNDHGRILGSLTTMSPEQAATRGAEVEAAADIFAIGAILFELLCGQCARQLGAEEPVAEAVRRTTLEKSPASASERFAALDAATKLDVAARRRTVPQRLGRCLRGDLDRIVARATAPSLDERYSVVSELTADLRRFLAGEPVGSLPLFSPRRLYRAVPERPVQRALLGALLVVGALASVFAYSQWRGLHHERGRVSRLGATITTLESEARGARNDARSAAAARTKAEEELARRERDVLLARIDRKAWQDAALLEQALGIIRSELRRTDGTTDALESAIATATSIAKRLPELRDRLTRIRAQWGEPVKTPNTKDANETRAKLTAALAKANAVRHEISVLERRGGNRDEATVLRKPKGSADSVRRYGFRRWFHIENPEGLTHLELTGLAECEFVVWINAKRTFEHRIDVHEGPGDSPATLAAARLRDFEMKVSIYAESLQPGANLIAVEATVISSRFHTLRLDLALRAITRGGRSTTVLFDRGRIWEYWDRGEFVPDKWRADDFADLRWERGRGPFGFGFRRGSGRVAELRLELDRLELQALALGQSLAETNPGAWWLFRDHAVREQHAMLERLVDGLDEWKNDRGLLARAELALAVRQDENHARRWQEASDSIANVTICPKYRGMQLKRNPVLEPLGRDPESGLWEFLYLGTGDAPARNEAGEYTVTANTGIVLVLIPHAVTQITELSTPEISPLREVELGPFLIGKYELTQGQFLRLRGYNPSRLSPESPGGQFTLTHPVENLTWNDARHLLRHAGLDLPTEAQWEYGARAGTTTSWWSGDDERELKGRENIRGAEDGHPDHAPAGSLPPNAFGLHDMLGNVREWCRVGVYGLRCLPRHRLQRGGGYRDLPANAQASTRSAQRAAHHDADSGCRALLELPPEAYELGPPIPRTTTAE